jgi:hypothetical protein
MGINQVSVVGPRAEPQEQKKEKRDPIDDILRGLQIANGVLGIGVNYTTIQKHRAEQKGLDDTNRGVLPPQARQDAIAKGLQPVADGTPGSQTISYRTGEGEEGITKQAWILRQKKETPLTEAASKNSAMERLAFDKERFKYQQGQDAVKTKAAEAKVAAAAPNPETLKNLPPDQQIMVKSLASQNASRTGIANQMKAEFENFKNAKTENDKIKAGEGMLKLLNSPLNPDAVGAEEASRIGGFLQYKKGNFFEPGSFIGRDLDLFENQVADKIGSIDAGINSNQAVIDKYLGRQPTAVAQPAGTPEAKGGPGQAIAAPTSGKQDEQVSSYAAEHGLDYQSAKAILVGRGYKPNE